MHLLFYDNENILREYPELAEYPEFTKLTADNLKFVWYYASPTSNVARIGDEADRRKYAYDRSFAIKYGKPEKNDIDGLKLRFLDGNFPSDVRAAIETMRRFKPSFRIRAKMMVEKNFNDLEEISKKDLKEITDVDELKKYAELKLKVSEALPDLIKQLEFGFGIKTEDKKDSDKRQASFADGIHELMEQ